MASHPHTPQYGRLILAAAVLITLVAGLLAAGTSGSADLAVADQAPSEQIADLRQSVAEQEQARAEHEQELQKPASVAERQESATAFDDTSGQESEALLKDQFEDELENLDLDTARSLDDIEVEKFLSDNVARVTTDDAGGSKIAISTLPLRARDDGRLQALDLTLEAQGDDFSPDNGLIDVDLPVQVSDGFSVGPSDIDLQGAEASNARAFSPSDRFYPEVKTDTDLLAAPISRGLELYLQLRSPQAPTQFPFSVNLPTGATLERLDDGDVGVVRDGETLNVISAPRAVDAQGVEVPISLAIDSNRVILSVNHQAGEVAYPILVDPSDESEFWADQSRDDAFNQWDAQNTFSSGFITQNVCRQTVSCYGVVNNSPGYGLYVYARPEISYITGTGAHWYYRLPFGVDGGSNVSTADQSNGYVSKFILTRVRYRERGSSVSDPIFVAAIQDGNGDSAYLGKVTKSDDVTVDPGSNIGVSPCDDYNGSGGCLPGSPKSMTGRSAVFGMTSTNNRTLHDWRDAYAGDLTVVFGDDVAPRIVTSGTGATTLNRPTDNGNQGHWVSSGPFVIHERAADITNAASPQVGLGMKSIGVTFRQDGNALASPAPVTHTSSCLGSNNARCQAIATTGTQTNPPDKQIFGPDYQVAGSDLQDGTTIARVSGKDIANNSAYLEYPLRIDRSAPSISASGPVIAAANTGQTASDYGFTVAATDGSRGLERDQRSGATNIEVKVCPGTSASQNCANGKTLTAVSGSLKQDGAALPSSATLPKLCADDRGSCSLSADYQLDPFDYDDNTVTIQIWATDGAGNRTGSPVIKTVTLGGGNAQITRFVCHPGDGTPQIGPNEEGRGDNDCGDSSQWLDGRHMETVAFARDPSFDDRTKNAQSRGVDSIALTEPRSSGTPLLDAEPDRGGATPDPEICREVSSPSARVCPRGTGLTFDIDSSQFPAGVSTVTARVKDGFKRVSPAKTFKVKVDRSSPSVVLSGARVTAGIETAVYPGSGSVSMTSAENFRLHVVGTDAQSGMRSIEVTIVKHGSSAAPDRRFFRQQSCPSGDCQQVEDVLFHGRDYDNGQYDVSVVTTDQVGHKPPPSAFQLNVSNADSVLGTSKRSRLGLEQFFAYDSIESGLSSANVDLGTGNLVWHKTPIINPGRGLSSVVNLTYNSLSQTDPSLDAARNPWQGQLGAATATVVPAERYAQAGAGFSIGISGLTRVNEPLTGIVNSTNPNDVADVAFTDPDGTQHTFRPNLDDVATKCKGDDGQVGPDIAVPASYQEPAGVNLHLRRYGCTEQLRPGTYAQLLTRLNGSDPTDAAAAAQNLVDLRHQLKAWAITRPDGTTYFFDGLGYASSIEDRNHNTITYQYENANPLLGHAAGDLNPCKLYGPTTEAPVVPGVCEPRLTKVIDPAGTDYLHQSGNHDSDVNRRSLTIDYYDLKDVDGLSLNDPLLGGLLNDPAHADLSALGSALHQIDDRTLDDPPLPDINTLLGSLGKIESITDHAGRKLSLTYDPSGHLAKITEAAGGLQPRSTKLGYDDPTGEADQLIDVEDPNHGHTKIDYQTTTTALADPGRRVDRVRTRADSVPSNAANSHVYAYEQTESQQASDEPSATKVTNGRGDLTRYEIDADDRPTAVQDPLATGQTATRDTRLAWDDDNNVIRITRASGSDAETIQGFAYNDNGLTTGSADSTQSFPGTPWEFAGLRVTALQYNDGDGSKVGSEVNPDPLTSRFGSTTSGSFKSIDDGDGFVSDLTGLSKPSENHWQYGLDGRGNILAEVAPDSGVKKYSVNTHGEITADENEVHDITTYPSYDDNGLPQVMVDPRGQANGDSNEFRLSNNADPNPEHVGQASEHTWLYRYNEVGNLLQVVDPRGAKQINVQANPQAWPQDLGHQAKFTSTLTYDDYDRLIKEESPKDSGGQTPGDRQYLTNSYVYDDNGNLKSEVVGSDTTMRTYTPMDRLETEQSPEQELARFCYDGEEGLIKAVSPEGTRHGVGCGQAGRGWATEYKLDSVGRRVAEVRESDQSPNKDLITSYAFDARDNVIGVSDPRNNAGIDTTTPTGLQSALNHAASQSSQRFSYDYDDADQLISQVEDPGGVHARTDYRYDANGNQTRVLDPRAFDDQGSNPDDGGHTWLKTYDAMDRVVSEADPLGDETTYQYRLNGQLASMISPRASETSDADGDGDGDGDDFTTELLYNRAGDLVSRSRPYRDGQYGQTPGELKAMRITIERDAVGDPAAVRDPVGNVAAYRAGLPASQNAPATLMDDQQRQRDDHTFTNEFYDTGDLKRTSRPAFFSYAGTGKKLELRVDGSANVGAGSDPLPTSQGAGDLGAVAAEPMPGLLPDAGTTAFSYDGSMRLNKVTSLLGGPGTDPRTDLFYDGDSRMTALRQPYGSETHSGIEQTYSFDKNGNLKESSSGWDDGGDKVTSNYDYDAFDRKILERLPASRDGADPRDITRLAYDANSNLVCRQTPRGAGTSTDALICPSNPEYGNGSGPDFTWRYGYDALDRQTKEVDPLVEVSTYGYDDAGNRISSSSPLPNHLTKTVYDAANRPAQLIEASGRTAERTTNRSYDAAGNVVRIDAPGASAYDDSGTQPNVGTPVRQVTDLTYEGRDLQWKKTTHGVVNGAPGDRTTISEYDGNGNLRRVVNPAGAASYGSHLDPTVPFTSPLTGGSAPATNANEPLVKGATDHATVYEYNADDLQIGTYQPTEGEGSDSDAYRQGLTRDPRGWVHEVQAGYQWRKVDPNPAVTEYSYFDTGWIAGASDTHRQAVRTGSAPPQSNPPPADGDLDKVHGQSYQYDPRGNQTLWRDQVTDPSSANEHETRRVVRSYYPSGQLKERTGYFNPSDTVGGDSTSRAHSYGYNPNGSLTRIHDSAPTDETTNICYDGVERQTVVDDGGPNVDSKFGYDAGGNVATRISDSTWVDPTPNDDNVCDGHISEDHPRTTTFDYDDLDQEKTMTVTGGALYNPSTQVNKTRVFETGHYPSGQISKRLKPGGSGQPGTAEYYFYDSDGLKSARVRVPNGQSAETKTYLYDVDSNPKQDERGMYSYNARDQLTEWKRSGDYPVRDDAGGASTGLANTTVSYTLDGSGQITSEHDSAGSGTDTTFKYVGDRLDYSVVTPGGGAPVTFSYDYDAFGNMTNTTSSQANAVNQKYTYDEFGRLKSSTSDDTSSGGTDVGETYRYDGLDRRDQRTNTTGASAEKKSDYSYIGLSEHLSRESEQGSGPTHFYDYDSQGQRLGVEKGSGGNPSYRPYELDRQGSVLGLEKPDGTLPATSTYRNDPYGKQEKVKTAQGQSIPSDGDTVDNPFRFQGHYYDSGVATYDMRARAYYPAIARFTSEDRFESAGADLTLQSDPLTQNRYAFAGGNPTSGIDWDGHFLGYNDSDDPQDGNDTPEGREAVASGQVDAPTGLPQGTTNGSTYLRPVESTQIGPADTANEPPAPPALPPKDLAKVKSAARIAAVDACGGLEHCSDEDYRLYRQGFVDYATGKADSLYEGIDSHISDRARRFYRMDDEDHAESIIDGGPTYDIGQAYRDPRQAASAVRLIAYGLARENRGLSRQSETLGSNYVGAIGVVFNTSNDRYQAQFHAEQEAECQASFTCKYIDEGVPQVADAAVNHPGDLISGCVSGIFGEFGAKGGGLPLPIPKVPNGALIAGGCAVGAVGGAAGVGT